MTRHRKKPAVRGIISAAGWLLVVIPVAFLFGEDGVDWLMDQTGAGNER